MDNDDDSRVLEPQPNLIEASARGASTPAERDAVEQRPVGTASPSAIAAPAWSPWLVAGAVVLAALTSGLVWTALDNARLKRDIAAASSRPAGVPQAQSPPTNLPPSLVAEMTLGLRAAQSADGTRRVVIAPEAQVVRLQLGVEEAAPAFTVGVERTGAGRLSTQRLVTPKADGTLIVWLPADLVRAGNFDVLVWRGEESAATLVATYVFNAVGQ